MPEPLSGSHDTLKLAATWWLPDWQGSQGSRGSNDIGGGDIVKDDSDCMKHYNLYATCPSPKLSTGVVHPVAGMTCQKGCVCPSEYKYTSSNCSGKYTLSGGSCDGKYNDCVCKSEYSQNSSNCNGEYQPAGEACDGNYNQCEMRPECTISSKDCTYGCAEYNSCDRCTSCESDPACNVTDKNCDYGCESYNSCGKCISCKSAPCDSSSSNWCSVHSSCHGDCCSDGSIEACDTRCGGSGCSSSGEDTNDNTDNSGSSGGNSGETTPSCRCTFGTSSCPSSHPYSQDVTRSDDTCDACYYCGKGYITITEEITYPCAANPYHTSLYQYGTKPHQRCSTGESAYDVFTQSYNDYSNFSTMAECKAAEESFSPTEYSTGEVCGDVRF
ncbi:MAG: hypothetical protein KHX61_04705 [Proteobacteria bacterium]|nr:hypothetical protein [Pseudomonadota bacterium]